MNPPTQSHPENHFYKYLSSKFSSSLLAGRHHLPRNAYFYANGAQPFSVLHFTHSYSVLLLVHLHRQQPSRRHVCLHGFFFTRPPCMFVQTLPLSLAWFFFSSFHSTKLVLNPCFSTLSSWTHVNVRRMFSSMQTAAFTKHRSS